jgi:hypothetical protein
MDQFFGEKLRELQREQGRRPLRLFTPSISQLAVVAGLAIAGFLFISFVFSGIRY